MNSTGYAALIVGLMIIGALMIIGSVIIKVVELQNPDALTRCEQEYFRLLLESEELEFAYRSSEELDDPPELVQKLKKAWEEKSAEREAVWEAYKKAQEDYRLEQQWKLAEKGGEGNG